jgi:hypothetical protein
MHGRRFLFFSARRSDKEKEQGLEGPERFLARPEDTRTFALHIFV